MQWAFAGTPVFAERIFSALLEAGYIPECVLTQPDRPSGRGMKLTPSPVKERALAAGVPVLQPERLRDQPEVLAQLSEMHLDVLIVVAYGLIVPPSILALPRWGCWNVHASLLPRWRGAAPIHRAIQAGDVETGVGIMRMEVGLDTGPVYHMLHTPIESIDTAGSLHDRLAKLGAKALLESLVHVQAGSLPLPIPQSKEGICYAEKIRTDEARLDWSKSAEVLERQIRAFNPAPGAWTLHYGERLKVWRAEVLKANSDVLPGTVMDVDGRLVVVCGESSQLQLHTLQRAGAQRMDAKQWWQINKEQITVFD